MKKDGRERGDLDDGYPTRKILFSDKPPDLMANRIESPYHSVAEYLDIQFGLLLEDFIFPLREALKKYDKNTKDREIDGVKIYPAVSLHLNQILRGKQRHITGVLNVEGRVLPDGEIGFGSLLLFTRNNFRNDFFLGVVTSEEKDHTGRPVIEVKIKVPRGKHLSLEELSCNRFTAMKANAFFYMYFHVLKSLNTLNDATFPMKRYIVFGRKGTHLRKPAYLDQETNYNIFGVNVPVMDLERWPSVKAVGLNKQQYSSLKRVLTEEIALVQGPPGTGKTYFGIKVVKVLLDNVAVWNQDGLSSLLIVCQSNRALDHFMEGVLKITNKVVRVGARCQSEKLKPRCLKELVCRKIVKHESRGLRDDLKKIDRIRLLRQQLFEGIVGFNVLKSYGVVGNGVKFESEDCFLKWMGFKIGVLVESNSSGNLVVCWSFLSKVIARLEETGEDLVAEMVREEQKKVEQLIADYRYHNRWGRMIWTNEDILSLKPIDARVLYLYWVKKLSILLQEKQFRLEKGLQSYLDQLPFRKRLDLQLNVLRSAFVVGLTSTGAASRRDVLEKIQSPIVIIEEAAAVLESHVVVSLTHACKHLILLGDHKQLKPGLTTYHMGTDFNLNISLFERLFRSNIVDGTCLSVQYRMRPEISSLLKRLFYNQLIDAKIAKTRPHIKGVLKNLFFLDHEETEEKTKHNASVRNLHEVEMLTSLAKYLVFVGYTPRDITIITMYSEQRNKFIEARDSVPSLIGLQIASVDSFQGKENEIILLSLVRSNTERNIGFLKEDNRVCVALSRARSGLFIMGNMKCLAGYRKESLWDRVQNRLEKQNAIGTQLTLFCEKHTIVHHVSKTADWNDHFCRFCNWERNQIISEEIEKPKIVLADTVEEKISAFPSCYIEEKPPSLSGSYVKEISVDTAENDIPPRNYCCACTDFCTRPITRLFRLCCARREP